jgi:hypothetical protein
MTTLSPWQYEALRRFADERPHRVASAGTSPAKNLIRRNMITKTGPHGSGLYLITEFGLAVLAAASPLGDTRGRTRSGYPGRGLEAREVRGAAYRGRLRG